MAAEEPDVPDVAGKPRRIARNTAIFSAFTGVSRVAGMVREIIARAVYTQDLLSAFTIAFQVPNLVRALFADAALSAAFIPVFTDLMERDRKREAVRLASTLFFLILLILGSLTLIFIVGASVIMPVFTGAKFLPYQVHYTITLSQILFPIVLMLGLNGLFVGILQTYDQFAIPASSPIVWNAVIIALLLLLRPSFHGFNTIYAYAIGILIATAVQMLMAVYNLWRIKFHFVFAFEWRDPRVKQVLLLMLPVTIGLGIINFDLLINSTVGTLVSGAAPAQINSAFLIYMLPQGMFSVAVATVLFPAMSAFVSRADIPGLRHAIANGLRQINLLLIPSAAFLIVLSTPVVRLLFQHGKFTAVDTHFTSVALFWFAFSLPFAGVNLLLARGFFSLQKPWVPTMLAAANMVIDVIASFALYKPLGIAGPVIGTVIANAYMTYVLVIFLRPRLGGLMEGRQTAQTTARIALAAAGMAVVSWGVWTLVDSLLGRSVPAQIVSMAAAIGAAALVYGRLVLRLGVPEAQQVADLLRSRLGRVAT